MALSKKTMQCQATAENFGICFLVILIVIVKSSFVEEKLGTRLCPTQFGDSLKTSCIQSLIY